MTWHLYDLQAGAIVRQSIGQWPATRHIGDPEAIRHDAPPGHIYIPGLPRPVTDPAGEACERAEPTEEGWGWTVRPLTAEELAARAPVADPQETISALGGAFGELIPAEHHVALAGVFTEVRVLLEAGMPHLARRVIEAAAIPPVLEPLRASFAGMIPVPE